jgi:hypothetical protein
MDAPFFAYAEPIETAQKKRAEKIILPELEKYPDQIIAKNLRTIHILGKLQFFQTIEYGGTASSDALYLVVKKEYDDTFIASSVHHEFSSVLLNKYLDRFDQDKWTSPHPPEFTYLGVNSWDGEQGKDGGARAIAEGRSSLKLETGPEYLKYGFLSEYSKSSLENDFNLYAAMVFTDNKQFKELLSKYPAIKLKYELLLEFYRSIDPAIKSLPN